jgi:hypothetical protein
VNTRTPGARPNELPLDRPAPSTDDLMKSMHADLALRPRFAYLALLLMSLSMAIVIAALWTTEPSLPVRTQVAFGVILAMALCWIFFALHALTGRRVLFAPHRVVAGWMGVVFSACFLLGSLSLVIVGSGRDAAALAAVSGVAMLIAASALLVRARRQYAALVERRHTLETLLNRGEKL